jgi:glycosyltransferase involved in cell wall biosynthesis
MAYVLDHQADAEQLEWLLQSLPSLCRTYRVFVVNPDADIPRALHDIGQQFPDVEIIGLDLPMHASWLLRMRTLVALFRELRVTHAHVVAHTCTTQHITLMALKIARIPRIIMVIGIVDDSETPALRHRLHAFILHIPHQIVVTTAHAKQALIHGYGLNEARIAVIPIGIDDQRYLLSRVTPHTRDTYQIPSIGHLIGMYAPLTYDYGADLLIRALATIWQYYPDTQVVIAGDGPHAPQLHALAIQSLQPSHIHFVSTVDDLAAFFAGIDVVVFPARRCAMPTTLLLAMALERPVIGSAIPNIQDVIEANGSGLLTRPNDAEALASTIMRLMNDHALRISIAFNARTRVSQRFRKDAWLAALLHCYQRLY